MPKISNIKLANQKVFASREHLEFDKHGIAEVKSEEVYNNLLDLEGYHAVEEKSNKDKNDEEPKKDAKKDEEPEKEKAPTKDSEAPTKDTSKK